MPNVEALDGLWKGKGWSDGERLTRVPQSDGTIAEGMAGLLYGWDATSGTFNKLPVDHSTGALNVAVVAGGSGGGGGGTSLADKATFTEGTTALNPIGGEFNDSGAALVAGVAAAARMTSRRALHAHLRDASGVALDDGAGNLNVNIKAGAAAGGTSSSFGAADPGSGTAAGFSDGANMREARVFDVDSGAGTQYVQGVSLRKTASGGSVDFGTSTDPIRTDPTGTTIQPVSGSVTANIGTTNGLALDATLTGGTQKTKLVDTGGVNVGSISAAGALKVDGSAVTQPVSGTFWQATQPVSGTVTGNQGTPNSLANRWPVQVTDGTNVMPTGDAVARALFQKLTDGTNTAAVKAGSTPAAAADPALVVAISPNNSVAVTGTFWQATQPVSGTVTAIQQGSATSGASYGRQASSLASTNPTSVKASPGTLYGVHVLNTNAAVRYLHLYDKASPPTVGTDTPVMTVPVPPSNGGIVRTFTTGLKFTSGIAYAMTTDAAAGNNAVAAGDLVGLGLDYV